MNDAPAAHYSRRTQPRRPKNTAAERLALGNGHTLTAEEYRRIDGGRQPLYAEGATHPAVQA